MTKEYKLSRYTVFTKNVVSSKYQIAYSTLSNKLLAIDKNIVQEVMASNFGSVPEKVLSRLIDYEFIVPIETNELEKVIARFQKFIVNDDLLYQVIQPSADCQLGCNYCGQVHTKGTISNENIDEKIYNRIVHNLSKKEYKTLGISWFGGEPLMGLTQIKKLSKRLIALAKDTGLDYTAKMVTNGLSLKKHIFYDLFFNYRISSFEITLDGSQRYHDERRHTKRGQKTFDIIIQNIEQIVADPRFLNSGVNINIRSNIDGKNNVDTEHLINLLEERGILKYVNFYLAPLHAWGNDAHKKAMTRQEFADFEAKILLQLMRKNKKMQAIPSRPKDIVCMSLYDNSELFDAKGNVYNCTEISQVPMYSENNFEYRIGELKSNDHSIIDSVLRPFSNWNNDILNEKVPCHQCRILPICGGGCPKLWGEGLYPCPSMKDNIEDRVFLQFYQDNLNHDGHFVSI